jgi:hypothetical protein
MIDDKKSIDPGLSAAERKSLRIREAEEAIAEHESAQKAFNKKPGALAGRTSQAGGSGTVDALPGPRATGRYPHHERSILDQGPECTPRCRPEDSRRGPRNGRRNAAELPGSWTGLDRLSS